MWRILPANLGGQDSLREEALMKKPAEKIHLIDVDEPLLSFHDLEMRCKAVLRNARPEFMVSGDFGQWLREVQALALEFGADDDHPFLRGMCAKCVKAEPGETETRRYIYGLIEGQVNSQQVDE